jgi:hypothetical protein
LRTTSRTRSSDVNVTLAIAATSIACADNNTIARRHVTTDPDDRRTIRNKRIPSSLVSSLTRTVQPSTNQNRPADLVGDPQTFGRGTSTRSTSDSSPIDALA